LLASAWSSSRSQLAAHSGFAFERECSYKILVSGSEGRAAARQKFSGNQRLQNTTALGGPILKRHAPIKA